MGMVTILYIIIILAKLFSVAVLVKTKAPVFWPLTMASISAVYMYVHVQFWKQSELLCLLIIIAATIIYSKWLFTLA